MFTGEMLLGLGRGDAEFVGETLFSSIFAIQLRAYVKLYPFQT